MVKTAKLYLATTCTVVLLLYCPSGSRHTLVACKQIELLRLFACATGSVPSLLYTTPSNTGRFKLQLAVAFIFTEMIEFQTCATVTVTVAVLEPIQY